MHESGYPIWPPYEAFYIRSMVFNTQSACKSIDVISAVIEHLESGKSDNPLADVDTHDVLNELQNIVVQGAAVSRYFWPVRRGHERRAEQLRSAFGMTERSPLYLRDLRNDIEHFDEKLDRYLSSGIVGTILPEYFGTLPESNGVPVHLFRAYYFDVGQFQLLGNRYEVQPIVDELLRLHEALEGRDNSAVRV